MTDHSSPNGINNQLCGTVEGYLGSGTNELVGTLNHIFSTVDVSYGLSGATPAAGSTAENTAANYLWNTLTLLAGTFVIPGADEKATP